MSKPSQNFTKVMKDSKKNQKKERKYFDKWVDNGLWNVRTDVPVL